MYYLIFQYYKIKYNAIGVKDRQKEIDQTFLTNLENPMVTELHWLVEDDEDIEYFRSQNFSLNLEKLKIYMINKRITYQDVFKHTNKYLNGKTCIYLHADMSLDRNFPALKENTLINHIIMFTPHNKKKCKRGKIKCGCSRTYLIDGNYYGTTFDGLMFQSPINEKVVEKVNHIVHLMGAENRLIYFLKKFNYIVYCANLDYRAYHNHEIKVFHNLHSKWVDLEGNLKPLEFYSNIHKKQKDKPFEQQIVGGGVPFFEGTVKFI